MGKSNISKTNKDLKWTLLREVKNDKVDKLFTIYSEDKGRARIFYFLNKGRISFKSYRTVLFEDVNGDFRIMMMEKNHGISINGKMYIHEKLIDGVTYTKSGGFHYIDNTTGRKYIKQLDYLTLNNFARHLVDYSFEEEMNGIKRPNLVMDYFMERFSWLRYIKDNGFWGVKFNVIKRHKLYGLKSMLRHYYGCPYPQAKFIHEYTSNNGGNFIVVWKEMKKVLLNIESLNVDLFNHPLFSDSCRMARMVGKKVNCSWGVNRLKVEHDKWAKEITMVLLETEELRDLNIRMIYKEFAEYSGFELLTTNHALLEEGVRMNHCVGTYSNMVDDGTCAIYRVLDCTLQLTKTKIKDKDNNVIGSQLHIGQYMDIGNTKPSTISIDYVKEKVEDFNKVLCNDKHNKFSFLDYMGDDDELPF